jgi:hypothetical protein
MRRALPNPERRVPFGRDLRDSLADRRRATQRKPVRPHGRQPEKRVSSPPVGSLYSRPDVTANPDSKRDSGSRCARLPALRARGGHPEREPNAKAKRPSAESQLPKAQNDVRSAPRHGDRDRLSRWMVPASQPLERRAKRTARTGHTLCNKMQRVAL